MAIRSTRQSVDILTNGNDGKARVSRQYVEILSSMPTPAVDVSASDSFTLVDSSLGGFIRTCVAADSFTVTELVGGSLIKRAADTLALNEGVTLDRVFGVIEPVALTETVHLNVVLGLSHAESLVLSESTGGSFTIRVRAYDALTVADVVSVDLIKPVRDTLTVAEQVSLSRIFGVSDTIVLTDTPALSIEHYRSASDALVLSDAAAEYFDTAADTFSLSDSASVTRSFRIRAADAITLSDTASAYKMSATASDSLELDEFAWSNQFFFKSASDTLSIADLARVARIWPVTSTETLQYSFEDYDEATGETYTVFYGLQDTASVAVTREPRGASDSLHYLGERAVGIVVRADAIPASCADALTLTDTAWASMTPSVVDTLVITDVAAALASKTATDVLDITDAASTLVVRSVYTADTLVITDAILFEAPYSGVECQYHPFVGSGSMPVAIPGVDVGVSPPVGFQLCYPPAGPFTDTLALRNPRFGNRDRVQMNRISRETRGGTLIVFADSIWPKVQTQVYQFEGLSWEQADGLFEFLDAHLGVEIGILDHEGRYWCGVVSLAEEPIAHDGKRGYSVGFEFEGELASYPV